MESQCLYNSYESVGIRLKKKKIRFAEPEEKRIARIFTAPAVIIVFLVLAIPMLFSFFISFTNYSMLKTDKLVFIGLGNYIELFRDRVFMEALQRTALYIFLSIGLEFLAGMGIALLISRHVKPQGALRTLLTIPMMFAPVQVGFLFKWIFNDQTGLINNLVYSVTGIDRNIAWLVEPGLGFLSILTAEVWMSTPFMVLILLAGLVSLSKEPFEAAKVDGASSWQQFRFVTLPLMERYIYISLVIRSMDIARTYDIIRIMTDGGPANRTEMIWTYVYRLGITSNKFAMGSAMSFVTVALAYVLVISLFRCINRTGSDRV